MQFSIRPYAMTVLLGLLGGGFAFSLSGCGQGLEGEWEVVCEPSFLAPESSTGCYARLNSGTLALALLPEDNHWLLASAWMEEDFLLVQSSFDATFLRRTVRAENGFCLGRTCWMEFSTEEVQRWAQRSNVRIELTRVFWNEEGRMRRGTKAFSAPTRGLPDILQNGLEPSPDRSQHHALPEG